MSAICVSHMYRGVWPSAWALVMKQRSCPQKNSDSPQFSCHPSNHLCVAAPLEVGFRDPTPSVLWIWFLDFAQVLGRQPLFLWVMGTVATGMIVKPSEKTSTQTGTWQGNQLFLAFFQHLYTYVWLFMSRLFYSIHPAYSILHVLTLLYFYFMINLNTLYHLNLFWLGRIGRGLLIFIFKSLT